LFRARLTKKQPGCFIGLFVGHIIKKIKACDIPEYQRRYVRFTVISNDLGCHRNVFNKLTSEAQIDGEL
jgi:hypothetical protein